MRVFILLGAASVLAAGCAVPTTAVDANFGQALIGARAAQVVDPDAPSRARPALRSDGQAAKSAIDRYQKSFDVPPPPVNVLNIGIGSGGSGGGSQ
ncbi:hypothetical protein [Caenimonas sp. SL110]|uniref:hypothetical protein n=1 Tax=Caenimonas sp. SL110 TaxID=1450524 RepID=UPI00065399B0|nr:hypothetical protein [Caenimonas sp. SL110]